MRGLFVFIVCVYFFSLMGVSLLGVSMGNLFGIRDAYAAKPPKPPKPPTPITIENVKELDFATAVKPESGSVLIRVKKKGTLASGPTTATMLDTSTISNGEKKIKGSNTDSIQIYFNNCGSNSGLGLKLKRFAAKYGGTTFIDQAVALDPPKPNGKKLVYGADIVINSSGPSGELSPCYDIVVTYE